MRQSTVSLAICAALATLFDHPRTLDDRNRRLATPRGNSKLYEPAPAIKRERTDKEKRRKAKRGF